MSLVTVNLVEGFLEFESLALQFDLNQWQTVYEQRYIIAILILAFHADLMRDLIQVLTPVFGVQEFEIQTVTIISDYVLLFSEGLGFLKYRTLAQDVQNLLELRITEPDSIMFFKLGLEIRNDLGFVLEIYQPVTEFSELLNQFFFQYEFGLA
jgi:hypothetical protein